MNRYKRRIPDHYGILLATILLAVAYLSGCGGGGDNVSGAPDAGPPLYPEIERGEYELSGEVEIMLDGSLGVYTLTAIDVEVGATLYFPNRPEAYGAVHEDWRGFWAVFQADAGELEIETNARPEEYRWNVSATLDDGSGPRPGDGWVELH